MRARATFVVVAFALVTGCAAASRSGVPAEAPAEAVPDYPRLRARIDAFVAATTSGDSETAYEIHAPIMRAQLSLDEFKRDREDGGSERSGPVQMIIHAVTPCACGEVSYPPELVRTTNVLRCLLLIDGSVVTNGAAERSRFFMVWEHIGGEWYYLLAEEGGDECPRPNR